VKIIECPRDAMQGLHEFIPTHVKTDYINQLLSVGFDTIDFGSFVSPKAIPQMRDTAQVLDGLTLDKTNSKLLAIVANKRGAEDALSFDEIDYLGFPLSISPQFQLRNTNKSIEDALKVVEEIQALSAAKGKQQVVYISMGFGNPYDEPFNEEIVADFVQKLVAIGIQTISLADTIGAAQPEMITRIFKTSIATYPEVEFGAHFHSTPDRVEEKIVAAYASGCRRFDGAIKGYGGCPMAKEDLTGNIPTEFLIQHFEKTGVDLGIDRNEFDQAMVASLKVFPSV
jgi:hydroxymethylglutaryl-CoA lyase